MQVMRLTIVGLLAALVSAPSAVAGDLTLHPSGFGDSSYAAWKAKQGEPDNTGNAFQAMYFQKFVPTPTFAAGVVKIRGLEGTPAEELEGLAWDHRTDGHCGAGAPRWNVYYETGGAPGLLFLGCSAAEHEQLAPASGHGWCRDTQPSSAFDAIPPGSTITGLEIVFDEGSEVPNAPPLPCDQEQAEGGFVYLDNISVTVSGETHTWKSAADNGN